MLSTIIKAYLILINALAFHLMLADKRKAKRNAWRISEATLLWIAAFGGSIGALLGMHLFRHKTKHPRFYIGLPLILILQIAVIYLLRTML